MTRMKTRQNFVKSCSSLDYRKILSVVCLVAAFDDSDGAKDKCDICTPVSKHYPGLGNFNSLTPFPNVVPQDEIDTRFLLFNRPNTNNSFPLDANENSYTSSTFNPSLETKVIVHGYHVKITGMDFIFALKDKLLSYGNYNVILVDWTKSNGGNLIDYPRAIANARVVAAQLKRLLLFLMERAPISPLSIHILGHSLGAHLAGWTGEGLVALRKTIARISSMDAAAPYFEHQHASGRIDPTDAIFVDATHTNSGNMTLIIGYGIKHPVGHIDFYPNGGGTIQPGCENDSIVDKVWPFNSCSHRRVVYLYTESVDTQACNFTGVECSSWKNYLNGKCENNRRAVMGFHATRPDGTSPGVEFYLKTADKSPFCIPS